MPFAENSYVVWVEGNDAVVVDPGFEPELILEFLAQRKLGVAAIVNTHGHSDHIAGNAAMKRAYPAVPIIIGVRDAPMLTDAKLNLSAGYGFDVISPPADRTVTGGDVLTHAGMEWEVRDLPGHSPGHVVYLVRGTTPLMVLGGDVLFAGGVGRYDFPGGSFNQLRSGIRSQLYTLPDDTQVYPGHGPPTTIGVEKRTNPFVAGDD